MRTRAWVLMLATMVIAGDVSAREPRAAVTNGVPVTVTPLAVRVVPGASFQFAIHGGLGTVHARLLGDVAGASLRDDGSFTAPAREGRYQGIVTESGSDREVVLSIEVAKKAAPLRPRAEWVAVPIGGRAPLTWSGGSGNLDVTLSSSVGVRRESDASATWIDVDHDAPASFDAIAVDRTTRETSRVHIVTAAPLPTEHAAGDRAGTSAAFSKSGEAFVGSPEATVSASLRRGRVDRFEDSHAAGDPVVGRGAEAHVGRSIVALDFDGDGELDLAVGDAGALGALGTDQVDPDGCLQRTDVAHGSGIVRIFSRAGDHLVERARAISMMMKTPQPPVAFGATLAAADLNGDRKGDLIVTGLDRARVETVLGRPFVAGKVLVVCHADDGPGSSPAYPPAKMTWGGVWWSRLGDHLASMGDVDGDGCDDFAFTIARDAGPIGVGVSFGYDAHREHCQGHDRPVSILFTTNDWSHWSVDPKSPDSFYLQSDTGRIRRAGSALASGHGDLTGDGRPDLAFGDDFLRDETGVGPAVEILSGTFIAGLCPDHVCQEGVRPGWFSRGEIHVAALSSALASQHVVLRGSDLDRRFGASLAIADADGDGHLDLAVGAPEGEVAAQLTGDVQIFRGPLSPAADAHRPPWALAVGDARERGGFGESTALARGKRGALLLVGAPRSSSDAGAAYLFHLGAGTE